MTAVDAGIRRRDSLRRSLPDERSGRVVFLSHCLLNQNTRYLGGAVCPGVVGAAVEPWRRDGVGVVQMPCPEQRVWGGVLKRHLLWVLDHPWAGRASPVLVPLVRRYLRWRYRRLARRVAGEVEDYQRSGLSTVAVVGVAGSPSCGVATTLDLTAAGRTIGSRDRGALTTQWMNEALVGGCAVPGEGLFVEALTRELRRRRLDVPIEEHELPVPTGVGTVTPPGPRPSDRQ